MAEVLGLRRRKLRKLSIGRVPYRAFVVPFVLSDFIIISLASVVSSHIYDSFGLDRSVDLQSALGIGIAIAVLLCSIGLSRGLYEARADAGRATWTAIVACWTVATVVGVVLLFLFKVGAFFSRVDILLFYFLGCFGLLLSHMLWFRAVTAGVRDGVLVGRRAVVIGEGSEFSQLGRQKISELGFEEVRRFAITQNSADLGEIVERAIIFARRSKAEEIILAVGWHDADWLARVVDLLRATPLPASLLPDLATRTLAGKHMPFKMPKELVIELQRAPLNKLEQSLKRLVDILGASIGLAAMMPIFCIIALLIKSDSKGPVFFQQRRAGFDRKVFKIYKFRSMSVMEDGNEITQATASDRRVTRVGAVLRRTSLDEIPQLINVLRGEMSLVGPRPHALAHDAMYNKVVEQYAFRHHVKPGITGWAQVNGLRGETSTVQKMSERVERDLWYIDNWSFWLDVWIMFRTCISLNSSAAY